MSDIKLDEFSKRESSTKVDNKDPNFAYRWVSLDPKVFYRRKGEAWQPVEKEEEVVTPFAQIDENGHRRHGDLILCKRPMNMHKRQKKREDYDRKSSFESINQEDRAKGLKNLQSHGRR